MCIAKQTAKRTTTDQLLSLTTKVLCSYLQAYSFPTTKIGETNKHVLNKKQKHVNQNTYTCLCIHIIYQLSSKWFMNII